MIITSACIWLAVEVRMTITGVSSVATTTGQKVSEGVLATIRSTLLFFLVLLPVHFMELLLHEGGHALIYLVKRIPVRVLYAHPFPFNGYVRADRFIDSVAVAWPGSGRGADRLPGDIPAGLEAPLTREPAAADALPLGRIHVRFQCAQPAQRDRGLLQYPAADGPARRGILHPLHPDRSDRFFLLPGAPAAVRPGSPRLADAAGPAAGGLPVVCAGEDRFNAGRARLADRFRYQLGPDILRSSMLFPLYGLVWGAGAALVYFGLFRFIQPRLPAGLHMETRTLAWVDLRWPAVWAFGSLVVGLGLIT